MADDPNLKTLWMCELPYWMEESYLYAMLQGALDLSAVKIIRNKATNVSEGYGFVEFNSHAGADAVLRQHAGQLIPGTDVPLKITWAVGGGRRFDEEYSLFIGDIAPDVTELQLMEEFRRYFGSVKGAKIVSDPLTGRSKGYGFVRFTSEPERDRSLGEMQGYPLNGRCLRCSIAQSTRGVGGGGSGVGGGGSSAVRAPPMPSGPHEMDGTNTVLFIGGLSAGVTEDQLRGIFSRFGDVTATKIPPGKGCGFVHFLDRRCAEVAMADMNGQIVGSGPIRISWGKNAGRVGGGGERRGGSSGYGYDAYPPTYPGYDPAAAAAAAAYPGYGAVAAGADPYAAYGAAYAAPAAAAGGAAYSGYSTAAGAYGSAGVPPAGQGAAAAAAGSEPVAVYDPLLPPDVDKLNAAYMHRRMPVLTGCYLHARSDD